MSLRLLIILPSVSSANSCHRHTESVPMLCSSPQLRQLNPAVGITTVFCGMLFAAHGQPHNLFKIIMFGFPLLRGKHFFSLMVFLFVVFRSHVAEIHMFYSLGLGPLLRLAHLVERGGTGIHHLICREEPCDVQRTVGQPILLYPPEHALLHPAVGVDAGNEQHGYLEMHTRLLEDEQCTQDRS